MCGEKSCVVLHTALTAKQELCAREMFRGTDRQMPAAVCVRTDLLPSYLLLCARMCHHVIFHLYH